MMWKLFDFKPQQLGAPSPVFFYAHIQFMIYDWQLEIEKFLSVIS